MSQSKQVTQNKLKDLPLFALFSLIFGSMMGSGVFDIPENVAHRAGGIAIIISWVITTIGMLSLGWALSYITSKQPGIKSGIYGYAKNGFGDYMGFNSAWGYWLNAILGNASYLIYIFATLGNFAIFKFLGNGVTFASLVGESLLIWIVYGFIIRGIKEAALINIVITTIKLLALLVIILFFIYEFRWNIFKSHVSFELHLGTILSQIKSTMLVTVWDFLGIEAACIYALRAKNMQDVATATMLGVITVLIIDALISILPFGILSGSQIRNLATPSTASLLMSIGYSSSAILIRIAVTISVVGALLAWMMLATNMLYLAAYDRALPKYLTKMNRKNVPSNALLVSSIVLQVFIIIAYFTSSVYIIVIQLATSLILVPYLLSSVFAFKLIIKEHKVDIVACTKGVLAVVFSIWLVYAGGLKFLIVSTLLYTVGIIFYAIAQKEQNKPIFANITEKIIFIFLVISSVITLLILFFDKII